MASTRTQIYLTEEQRRRLDRMVAERNVPLAALVREAVDAYLASPTADVESALSATFGSMPGLVVPSRDEWDRG
jgi:predicted DNA-binding protein